MRSANPALPGLLKRNRCICKKSKLRRLFECDDTTLFSYCCICVNVPAWVIPSVNIHAPCPSYECVPNTFPLGPLQTGHLSDISRVTSPCPLCSCDDGIVTIIAILFYPRSILNGAVSGISYPIPYLPI